jgi:hypothetical protein
MALLTVAGTTIPVAPGGSPRRSREDLADRERAFDGTYRVSETGTAKRNWQFQTPPLLRATADTYEAILVAIGPQTCAGDLIGSSISCCTEVVDWTPIRGSSGHLVVLAFALHEV